MTTDMRGQLGDEAAARLGKVFDLVEVWRDRVHHSSPDPATGSSLAGDDAATRPYPLSHAVVLGLVSAVDHVDALRVLIRDARVLHAQAPYSLLRVALENAAMAVWLLAPARRDERVLRRLRLQWADECDHVQAMKLMQAMTSEQAPIDNRLEKLKTKLQELAKDRGLPDELVRRVADRPRWNSIVETAGNEADELDGREAKWCWMVSSGIAHARSWATLTILERTEYRRTTDGVTHVEFQASDVFVPVIAEITALMINEGWRLFDQRRQLHIG